MNSDLSIDRSDLDRILERTLPLWEDARGAQFLFTGATGFMGGWLLETFIHANRRLNLNATATVFVRDAQRFINARGHIAADQAIELFQGSVLEGPFPSGIFPFVVHGATETNVRGDAPDPLKMFNTSVTGTANVLEIAARGKEARFLFLSSGAIYGRQPPELQNLEEGALLAPPTEDQKYAYGHGKRAAEFLVAASSKSEGIQGTIARCFAFSGAYLPIDSGFAIGNFIADALAGRPISINGDGTPLRSYLYGADMAVWLWTILFRGIAARPYNVGSDIPVSILELAHRVGQLIGQSDNYPIVVRQVTPPGHAPERYVPAIRRVAGELDLHIETSLDLGVLRMAEWIRTRA